ncbi:MAG: S9 family peptidase [Chloroflexota bacterium]|nr:S9 family peptidase [Dehalococcoidia bacterium]MDW8254244.1 S9 family peptidase [Chloroflexota bacterium]
MTIPLSPQTLVYGLTPAADPQLAPDGARLLYTVTTTVPGAPPLTQIWMATVDGASPRQLTRAEKSSVLPRWSPDGRCIAFVSSRGDGSAIFLMDADHPGEPRELTRHRVPIAGLTWSPDGTRLAYVAPVDPANPKEEPSAADLPPVRVVRRIDYKQDDRGVINDVRYQLFLVDAATGERRQLTRDPFDHFWPAWSPDGQTIAVLQPSRNEMSSQLALVALDGSVTLVGATVGFVSTFAWSLDGRSLLFTGDETQTWQSDFFLYDVSSGALRRLTHDLRVLPDGGFRTIVPPAQPIWLDERTVLFSAIAGGASGLYTLDLSSGTVQCLYQWGAATVGLSADAARRRLAFGYSSFERVGEIALYDRESGQGRVLTDYSGPVFAEAPPARHERLLVERGGVPIEGWLLLPPSFDPARRYPVVLDVHGGPNGYYGPSFNPIQQLLATNGFLVVIVNPRGSASYGRDFTMRVLRDWGGEDYLDLMAVLDHVLARPYADSQRVGIWGYSYGGYMTAWAIGQSDRFKAAVCGAPCFDLRSMYGTSDIGHAFGDLHWGGPPSDHEAWYAARSPSTFIHRATTPTLIIHGEADERCPIGQGEQMFVALKKAGCEVEFVRYPNCSHVFLRTGPPAYRADLYQRILDWFRRHLGSPE